MRIKELRKQLGLSQEKLAQLTGVTQSAISLWEDGKASPSAKKIKVLKAIFNCTADELLAD